MLLNILEHVSSSLKQKNHMSPLGIRVMIKNSDGTSLMTQTVKNLPAVQETWV